VLQDEWLHEKQAQLLQLKDTYDRTISCVGEGHRQAVGEQIVSWLHKNTLNNICDLLLPCRSGSMRMVYFMM